MKPSEILRLAAQGVEQFPEHCGCDRIGVVAFQHELPWDERVAACKAFEVVKPDVDPGPHKPWWGDFKTDSYMSDENHGARIVGLCLAAAIAESEGQ